MISGPSSGRARARSTRRPSAAASKCPGLRTEGVDRSGGDTAVARGSVCCPPVAALCRHPATDLEQPDDDQRQQGEGAAQRLGLRKRQPAAQGEDRQQRNHESDRHGRNSNRTRVRTTSGAIPGSSVNLDAVDLERLGQQVDGAIPLAEKEPLSRNPGDPGYRGLLGGGGGDVRPPGRPLSGVPPVAHGPHHGLSPGSPKTNAGDRCSRRQQSAVGEIGVESHGGDRYSGFDDADHCWIAGRKLQLAQGGRSGRRQREGGGDEQDESDQPVVSQAAARARQTVTLAGPGAVSEPAPALPPPASGPTR